MTRTVDYDRGVHGFRDHRPTYRRSYHPTPRRFERIRTRDYYRPAYRPRVRCESTVTTRRFYTRPSYRPAYRGFYRDCGPELRLDLTRRVAPGLTLSIGGRL